PLNAEAGSGNYGTATVTQPELTTHLDIYSPDFAAQQEAVKEVMPVKLVYDSNTQNFNLYSAAGASLWSGSVVPGQSQTLEISLSAEPPAASTPVLDSNGDPVTVEFSIAVSGTPQHNDSFTIAFNRDGQSDNRNALKLQDLQNTQTVGVTNGKGASFTTAYGSLVQQVGAKTAQAK